MVQKKSFTRRLSLVSLCGIASALLTHILSFFIVILGLNRTITGFYLSLTLLSFLSVFVPALIFSQAVGGMRKAVSDRKIKTGFFDSTLLVIFGFSGCIITNFLIAVISMLFPSMSGHSISSNSTDAYTVILLITSMAAAPAIFEEAAYRGFVLSALKKNGYVYSIVISSLIFGMLHQDISTAVFAWVSGMIFAVIRIRSGRIILSVTVHFLNNALAVAGNTAVKIIGTEKYTSIYYIVLSAAAVLFAICFSVLKKRNIFFRRKKSFPHEDKYMINVLSPFRKLVYTLACPAFIAFVIITLILKYL